VKSNPASFESAIALGAYDAGKPSDTLVGGIRDLGIDRVRALVVGDAVAGGQTGKAGGSVLVVGVARRATREDLVAVCADRVFQDLEETRA
jgi:phosphoglycolate phosphatase-like HAD superfamily hydrolase